MDFKGMSMITSMFIEHGTGRVLGPSLPIKTSGKTGWQGRPGWVKWMNGAWVELKDRAEIRAEVSRRMVQLIPPKREKSSDF